MWIRSWLDSPSTATHGNLIERVIFTRKDPSAPTRPEAELFNIGSISHASLEPNTTTVPTAHSDYQEILYVEYGEGYVTAGEQKREVREGSIALIPQGLSHSIINDTDEPLEMVSMIDDVPPGLEEKAAKQLVVRNYHEIPVGTTTSHWHHIVRGLLDSGDGLVTIGNVLMVEIDGMQIAEPHAHPANRDEVWYQLEGISLMFLDQEIRRQYPGEAVAVPPGVQHSSINDSDELMRWLYVSASGRA